MPSTPKMPSVDIINFEGLYTKQNPETLKVTQLRECKNADFFREYGSLSKLRGNTRVLSSQYSEDAVTKGIYWGSNYKVQDLSGAIDRQVIIAAGTTIQKINSDGTLTELLSDEPDELYRTSGQLDRFLFFTSQDPFDVGKRGQMSKYDGTRITQWGVTPPGSQVIKYTNGGLTESDIDTPVEGFDDSSLFTVSNATVEDSTQPAWRSTCVKMTKGTSSTVAYIERLGVDANAPTPFQINNIIEDRAQVQVFIPREHYRKLATSGRALSVYIGSGASLANDYYRYDFQIGRLYEGWNTLIFDFSTYPSGDFGTTVGTPDDDNLASYRFEVITNNATDAPVVYWDWFVSLDQGSVVPAFGDAGGLVFPSAESSLWSYKVTFVDDAGFESNAGPESVIADNTTGDIDYGQIDLTNIPVSKDGSVVKRNLYRRVASGSQFLYLDSINDNVTTTYTDTVPDTSLGSDTPPLLGDLIFDNSRPPSGGIMLIWKRTAFVAGDPLNPTILAYSRFDLPEAFPINNAIEFDERVTGLFKTYLGVVVTTETAYWRIIGDNPDYTVDKVIEGFGGVGPRAVGTGREVGWVVDRDGLRLYDLRDTIKISEIIRDRVDAFNKIYLEEAHTVHSRKNNALLWLTKDSSEIYSDIYMYQYMIDEVRQGWFSQIEPNPTTFNIQHLWEVEDSNGNFKLYAATSGGMVHEMLSEDSFNWLDDQGKSRAITMEVLLPYMRLGVTEEAVALTGCSGRVVPKEIELRIKENNGLAHTWTVTVDTSDSASENASVRDTQDIIFDFKAGQSLLRLPTQDLIPGEYVRLRLINSEKDKDLSIMGVKIYYLVRPGQYIVTGVSGDGVAGGGGQN